MAITFTNLKKLVAGSRRRHIVQANVSTFVYTGETVSPAAVGLHRIEGVEPLYGGGGYDVDYTGGKLMLYASGGVTAATGATITCILEIVGV
jgi:hypothetical protein